MKTHENTRGDRRELFLFLGYASTFVLSYFGARALLEFYAMATWLRILVVMFPILPFGLLLLTIIRNVRQMDELERRIQLEALAVAFPLTFLLLMTLGSLQLAINLKPEDWSYRHLWPFMLIFYLIGLMLAKRRYE